MGREFPSQHSDDVCHRRQLWQCSGQHAAERCHRSFAASPIYTDCISSRKLHILHSYHRQPPLYWWPSYCSQLTRCVFAVSYP
jgi:hypothetical protein